MMEVVAGVSRFLYSLHPAKKKSSFKKNMQHCFFFRQLSLVVGQAVRQNRTEIERAEKANDSTEKHLM
jgi:hypothetical protein